MAWPDGCPKPNSCERNRACMYGCAEHSRKPTIPLREEIDAAVSKAALQEAITDIVADGVKADLPAAVAEFIGLPPGQDASGFAACEKCTGKASKMWCAACKHNYEVIKRLTGRADLLVHVQALGEELDLDLMRVDWQRMVVLAFLDQISGLPDYAMCQRAREFVKACFNGKIELV